MERIVIVGGGAGGLPLATQLGQRLGRRGQAEITLVDAARTHVWKPLLHQVAAGSFDTHAEEIEYLAQARWNHFRFRLGRMTAIDRAARHVELAATHDERGVEIAPAQRVLEPELALVTNEPGPTQTLDSAAYALPLARPRADTAARCRGWLAGATCVRCRRRVRGVARLWRARRA